MTVRPHPKPPARPLRPPRSLQRHVGVKPGKKARPARALDRPFKIARCLIPRCVLGPKKTPGYAFLNGECKGHLIKRLDIVARFLVKERDRFQCQDKTPHVCNQAQVVQWAHTVTRRDHSTRWLSEGAVVLCERRHTYYTHRPEEWDLWCEARFGLERWSAIKHYALDTMLSEPADFERILAYLDQWKARGVPPASPIDAYMART